MNIGFTGALDFVLRMEGGIANDPADPGGLTNQGVTQRVYDSYRKTVGAGQRTVREMNEDERDEIYYTNYWAKGHCDEMPLPLSIVHFDACVNTGVEQALLFLQRALDVVADGIYGAQTRAAIKLACRDYSASYIASMRHMLERIFFYDSLDVGHPERTKFLTGMWLKRMRSLYREIDKIVGNSYSPVESKR